LSTNTLVTTTANAAQAVAPPNNVPYPSYTLSFTAVNSDPLTGITTATYSVAESPAVSGALAPVTVTYPTATPASITVTSIPGLTFTISGTPKLNDTVSLDARPSMFSVLDDAIADIASRAKQ
jgi:flagellar hook-associated protein 3 FlgL